MVKKVSFIFLLRWVLTYFTKIWLHIYRESLKDLIIPLLQISSITYENLDSAHGIHIWEQS